jgi:signal transduction histidine kinase
MFYRATERSEGAGLGLYIVRETVEKLQGTIAVDSEIGRGTGFKMTLPDMKDYQSAYI